MKLVLTLTLLFLASTLHAQERTATGALEVQTTWTALSAKVQAASDKAETVNIRMEQLVKCNKKGMDYTPGVTGADTDGCQKRTDITKIINCGQQGAVYSAATDTCIKASPTRWGYVGTATYQVPGRRGW